jgi:hypothetical protein
VHLVKYGRGCRDDGLFYIHGWMVFLKEPWRAVRLYPWMDGQIFAPAISALPSSLVVVCLKEPGMAVRCGYVIYEYKKTISAVSG